MRAVAALALSLLMIFSIVACGTPNPTASATPEAVTQTEPPAAAQNNPSQAAPSNSDQNNEQNEQYHIAIITPTLSVSEDEFRAGQAMVAKYPDIVRHVSLPERFDTELESCISTIASQADDPLMKAVIVTSGQSGLIPAFQQIKKLRPDILTITAPIYDDPKMMSDYIDLNIDTNWLKRGETITQKAYDMGAKTFIHYSFPTHLAKPLIFDRKEMMKETAQKLGMEYVEIVTPDPQTGNGPAAMQQFLREDIPRQIEKYGKDTEIFGTNCPMYDVIIDEALKLEFIVAEQCCPTPTQAFPQVLGLEIDPEDINNFEKINAMISEKVEAAGSKGRISGWPIPVTVFLPEFAVEVAKEVIDNPAFDVKSIEALEAFAKEKFDTNVYFDKLQEEYDNYFVMIMESIFY